MSFFFFRFFFASRFELRIARATPEGGREVVELDVRQAEGDGDVGSPAVDADRAVGRGEAIDERAELLLLRPDGAVAADRRGDRARALAFLAAGLRRRDRPASSARRRPQLDPVRLRPSLSSRDVPWIDTTVRGRTVAGDARADSPNVGGSSIRVPSAEATSSRARSARGCAVRPGSPRHHQPARGRLVEDLAVGAIGQAVAPATRQAGDHRRLRRIPAGRRSRHSARGASRDRKARISRTTEGLNRPAFVQRRSGQSMISAMPSVRCSSGANAGSTTQSISARG